ncbi:MAG: IS66-like element accessory protein TnpA [Hyphomicrobiaceae bacterium]
MSDKDPSGEKPRRRRWPEALKREIVTAAFAPGASVSVVARQYDVNANQVSGWRRRFSKAGDPLPSLSSMPGFVPVTIAPEPVDEGAAASAASDTIEIEVSGDVRIRVGSNFDDRVLKRVLDVLRRR